MDRTILEKLEYVLLVLNMITANTTDYEGRSIVDAAFDLSEVISDMKQKEFWRNHRGE